MPLPTHTLGRQLEELIAHFVVPGEKILWWGRPSFLLRAFEPMMIALAIVVLVLLFAFIPDSAGNSTISQYLTEIGYAVLIIVAGFSLLVLENWNRQRHTLYLLTSHRAIAFEATTSKHFLVLECWPEDLYTLQARWNRLEWIDGRDLSPRPRKGRFLGIWRSKDVQRLVIETLREQLAERFNSGDPRTCRMAIVSIAALSGTDWSPVKLLQDAQRHENPYVREQSTIALARAGQLNPARTHFAPTAEALSK